MFDPNDTRPGLFNRKKKQDEKIDLSKVPASYQGDLNLGLGIASPLDEQNATLKPTQAAPVPAQPPEKALPGLPAGLFNFGSTQPAPQTPQVAQPQSQQISMSRIPAENGMGLGMEIAGNNQSITKEQAANINRYLSFQRDDMPQLSPQEEQAARGRGRAYGAIQTANLGLPNQPIQTQQPSTAAQQPAATPQPAAPTPTPITSQVVSGDDHTNSDKLVRGVMGKNANENLQSISSDPSVRDTLNKAWAMRGAGIQVGVDPKTGGAMFTNSTGPEKMRYTGADGKPTNDWANTAEYKQGIDTAGRIKALADGMERQRYLDAGDGERLGAIDRMRQTDATVANANANQKIAQQELGIKKESHDAQMQDRNELKNLEATYKAETDPAKRDALERQIRVMRGKDIQPRYKTHVIPATKNADGSTTEGGVYVEDTQTGTGQWVNPGAQHGIPLPADPSQRKVGTVYTSPNGRAVKWDGKGVLPA